ncbi:hypothetical protein BDV19DRAFT_391917 [Aspergillus venezuelensis]
MAFSHKLGTTARTVIQHILDIDKLKDARILFSGALATGPYSTNFPTTKSPELHILVWVPEDRTSERLRIFVPRTIHSTFPSIYDWRVETPLKAQNGVSVFFHPLTEFWWMNKWSLVLASDKFGPSDLPLLPLTDLLVYEVANARVRQTCLRTIPIDPTLLEFLRALRYARYRLSHSSYQLEALTSNIQHFAESAKTTKLACRTLFQLPGGLPIDP